MAFCYCRWRRVLLCLCMPCILLALLITYVAVMVCFNMTSTTSTISGALDTHFIAPGSFRNDGNAPIPTNTFWALQPNKDALWNQLQQLIDRQYNPILRSHSTVGARNSSIVKDTSERSRFSLSIVSSPESQMADFEKLPSHLRDFVRYMHQREYPVLREPARSCEKWGRAEGNPQAPLLLLAIKSQEENFANRQAIRQTWGQTGWVLGKRGRGGLVQRVFLLGKNRAKAALNVLPLLELESQQYQDILQWGFHDSFFNLTLKDVLFWDWFSHFCPRTQFVFKGDDDVLVQTPALLDYLQEQMSQARGTRGLRSLMVGDVIGAANPIRDESVKYFIPGSLYKGLYPAYAGGGGVVYSSFLARRLNQVSRRVHLFPIDDVYVGMCLQRLGVSPIHHPAFLTFDFFKKEAEQPCKYHSILVVHKRNPAQITQIWMDLMATKSQCINATLRVEESVGKGFTKGSAIKY
ncbi:N-acetyllactosaminide beta-1,3-N-acetylglucosaminyltransferase 2 [Osmerus mordax]|uniref:N-acetyllactosaminide beta-1,3-N-acetylglucosaminyltransferase 2 n=1 Tax=Osmerus mordax TaxID=8014 RepID=UPI00350FA85B